MNEWPLCLIASCVWIAVLGLVEAILFVRFFTSPVKIRYMIPFIGGWLAAWDYMNKEDK